MGGCCCCSSRRADVDNGPAYYYVSVVLRDSYGNDESIIRSNCFPLLILLFSCFYMYLQYPRATEERVPLSSAHNRTSSAISSGVVVVDTNLETSSPDAYIPPPPPLPFEVAIGLPHTPGNGEETTCVDIREVSVETVTTASAQETVDGITLGVPTTCAYKDTDCKIQTEIVLESTEEIDPKLSKDLYVPIEEEEDCPICLEEYDIENPKLTARCEHDFHLACILEWMERSETCPVCNKEMLFDSPLA